MARGKIQIKRIENPINRQVTYSKRRNGLFKKAVELSVLCDAQVSIIMFSGTGKLDEYFSSTTTTKKLLDRYQRALNVDLWKSHYERMQESLKKLKEVNWNLRTQIRQRVGQFLDHLHFEELLRFEQDMEDGVNSIRERKFKVLDTEYNKHRKKVICSSDCRFKMFKNEEDVHRSILHEFWQWRKIHSLEGLRSTAEEVTASPLLDSQTEVHIYLHSGCNTTCFISP